MNKEFLKLRIVNKLNSRQIANRMKNPDGSPMRDAQIRGKMKNFRAGKYDALVAEMLREEEQIPSPPAPTPDMPEPPAPKPVVPPDDDDEYTPDGNDDQDGISPDPVCETVFTLISTPDDTPLGTNVDRMKRRLVYADIKPPFTMFNAGKRIFKTIKPENDPPGNYMVFDGEIKVKLGARNNMPIPAPDSVLLKGFEAVDVNTGLAVAIIWQYDEIGNWYIRVNDLANIGNAVIIKWKVACPLLGDHYWLDVKDLPAVKLSQKGWKSTALDPDLEDIADEMAKHLDLTRSDGLVDVISRLGKHCASFDCGTIPPGNMVKETFFNKVGACRHRALDFFIVALRLGIVCRYAVSDCHAWPELFHPKKKVWIALDLGGCDPGGPRNPTDIDPPHSPPKPAKPDEMAPTPPEKPEDIERKDIRQIMRDMGVSEPDIASAYKAWVRAGGKKA